MSFDSYEIISAIDGEINAIPKYYDFPILKRTRDENLWILELNTSYQKTPLDESFEGSQCWWSIKNSITNGAADILAVLPENQEIILRFATNPPPNVNENIRIYVPAYLETLKEVWSDSQWSNKCLKWFDNFKTNNNSHNDLKLQTSNFKTLRTNQSYAFNLLNWDVSFLWGPPGTGKTYTLGAILAQLLTQYPQKKILLLSTTNVAVDQALISVDQSLEFISKYSMLSRKKCLRAGYHYIATSYYGREHLLPSHNKDLIIELSKHESNRPEKDKIKKFAKWKLKSESIRKNLRSETSNFIDNAQLVAMTTTRALYTLDKLKNNTYDFVIFDEASQVGIAHAFSLAPLGNRCLFTGDFKQLAPINKSERIESKFWFGNSMFNFTNDEADFFCMLNEQSRMSKQICNLVSSIFYNNKLIMANDTNNKKWIKEHKVPFSELIEKKSVHLEIIEDNHTWSQKYNGPIRYNSAEFICELCKDITEIQDQKYILVLTPFRAQRILIKTFLRNTGLKQINVSTIHRAQGSERHTIIFDPVDGSNDFFSENERSSRLINVAFSRAKARLVIVLSKKDLYNKILHRVYNKLEHTSYIDRNSNSYNISEFVNDIEFPFNMIDICVCIKDNIGKVEVEKNGEFFSLDDGIKKRRYKTDMVKNLFQNKKK